MEFQIIFWKKCIRSKRQITDLSVKRITIIMCRTPLQPNADAMAMFKDAALKCKRRIQATGVSIWCAFTDEIFGKSNCRLLNHATLTYTTYHLTVFLYSLPPCLN